MPIDPSIALSARGVGPIQGLSDVYNDVERYRAARENAKALEEQRKAIADQRVAQTAKLQRDAQKEAEGGAALDELFSTYEPGKPMPTATVGKLYRNYGPERTSAIVKGLSDLHTADLTNADGMRKSMMTRLTAIKALPEDRREAAYGAVVSDYVSKGAVKAEEVAPYSPETIDAYEQQLLSPDKRYDVQHPKPVEHDPAHDLLNPQTGAVIVPGKAKEPTKPASAQEYEYAKTQGYKGSYEQYQNEDANRKRSVVNVSSGQPSDVKDTIAGMMDGTIPPQMPGRASKEYIALLAEAKRQGYNLAGAVTDWNATQKHVATLNGAQQLRLNQAINALPDMLDSVDALASKWKGGKFPLLNKANLALAKGGAYGSDVASVANQLDAQIADVTADLGNVYMGGNSPTDHALGLAGKSLNGEWDEKVLHDMVKLAKSNVNIRRNSINTTGVAGASGNNPYGAQPPAPAPAPAPASAGGIAEGAEQPIPGIPGGMAKFSNGKWIRIK